MQAIVQLFIHHMPAVALAISAVFLFIYWLEKGKSSLVISGIWCAYMLYEISARLDVATTALGNTRVDLLVIVPVLFALTLAAAVTGTAHHSKRLVLQH